MRKADVFPCRRYIVKYDDKGIAENAFSIKRNNTEDFPEFFDGRIFKPDEAAALTGKDCRKIAKRCNASPGTGEKARLDSHHISSKEYNGYIDAYCEESFLKRAEKMRKKAKTTAFPVAGQQDGNPSPPQETERNADEVPTKQPATNAKNAVLKKFWHNLKARFRSGAKTFRFSGRHFCFRTDTALPARCFPT